MARNAQPSIGSALSDPAQILRFSSAALPPSERMGVWREQFGRKIMNVEVTPYGAGDAALDAVSLFLPQAAVGRYFSRSVRLSRSRELLADGCTEVHFMFIRSGRAFKKSLWGEETAAGGAALLGWQAEPREFMTPSALNTDSVILNYDRLSSLIGGRDDCFVKPLPQQSLALNLLGAYVASINEAAQTPEAGLIPKIVNHFYDLAAVALGAAPDFVEQVRETGALQARLATMKSDIRKHLASSEISANWLALRHGVSPSYVRRIFESEGLSVSRFILSERLEKAHRRLCGGSSHQIAVSVVAYESGFADLSYFNRTFKRRFGMTPSEASQL